MSVMRPLIVGILAGGLGILAGALGTLYLEYFVSEKFFPESENLSLPKNLAVPEAIFKQRDWVRDQLYEEPVRWCYLKFDRDGWSATPINNLLQLKERVNTSDKEIVIPVFPTVYMPMNEDALYYNAIIESDIKKDDKVLVIGSGSGSDAWAAWLKSQSRIFVVEINPMAVANINTTARIANFPVKAIVGDITKVKLPKEFDDFDYVLWNMPYLFPEEKGKSLEGRNYHDGDDGTILKAFLKLLPSLLKRDGHVILLNTGAAREFIKFPDLAAKKKNDVNDVVLYTFSINAK